MRAYFTAIRKHGDDRFKIVLGPDSPRTQHRSFAKQNRKGGAHPEYAEIAILQPVRTFKLAKAQGAAPRVEPKAPVKTEEPKTTEPQAAAPAPAKKPSFADKMAAAKAKKAAAAREALANRKQ
jgi:hypothetical protein